MTTSEHDEVANILTELMAALEFRRDEGLKNQPLATQIAYRQGFTTAMLLIGSAAFKALLIPSEGDVR